MKRGASLYVLCALLAASLAACAQTPAAEPEARILYFTYRTDAEPGLLAPSRLRTALGVQAVSEWGDLMVLHASQPAEAVIIDGAAVAQVNAEDVARLYRECVVLAFFNLNAPEVAQLVDDPSVAHDGWMDGSEPYPSDFYIIVNRTASGSFGDCSGATPSASSYPQGGVGKGRSQYFLANEADFDIFVGVLITQLAQQEP
ncbi:MAG: hypothetical protein KIT08_00725 [Anaerolineales bacterium]|nr:MAG: hypothetical protein KIT08_00725 [Anaerolineales bacterium]